MILGIYIYIYNVYSILKLRQNWFSLLGKTGTIADFSSIRTSGKKCVKSIKNKLFFTRRPVSKHSLQLSKLSSPDGPEENSSKLLSTPFVEDPPHRLKWTAYLEFTHNHEVGDLTWDKVRKPCSWLGLWRFSAINESINQSNPVLVTKRVRIPRTFFTNILKIY